jgi:hypothetical protein
MSPDPAQQSRSVLVRSLVASGFVFVAAGIIVGLAVDPVWFLIALVGLIDFVLAWAFNAGHLGGAGIGTQTIPASEQPAAGPDVVAREATDDPSYNPYARED